MLCYKEYINLKNMAEYFGGILCYKSSQFTLVLVLLLCVCVDQFTKFVVAANVSSPDKRLWNTLLSGYGPISLRPVRNHTKTTVVSFRMLISQIVEFDERLQQIKISCWLKQQWFDEFLSWDPAQHGNVSQLYVPQTDVWVPDVTLYDNIDDHFEHVKDILLWISHTGLVTWYTPAILKSSCKVRVKNFPFDIQYCEMTFASWGYDSSELDIIYTNDSDATQNVFHSNGVWLLEKVHVTRRPYKFACCEIPWAFLVYSFEMKRSASFYISNIIVPCILLSFMTMMVFTLPPKCGEKIQLGMTNLLALILFQQLIAESMPPIGDETPIIGTYFMAMITISCLSITVTVTVLSIFHSGKYRPVPNKLKRFANFYLSYFLPSDKHSKMHQVPGTNKSKRRQGDSLQMEAIMDLGTAPTSNSAASIIVDSESMLHDEGAIQHFGTSQHTSLRERVLDDWNEIALIFDKVFGYLLLIATVTVLAYVMIEFIIIMSTMDSASHEEHES